jgi:hypothetical protein
METKLDCKGVLKNFPIHPLSLLIGCLLASGIISTHHFITPMTAMLAIFPETCRHPGSLHSILREQQREQSINFSIENSPSQLRDTS